MQSGTVKLCDFGLAINYQKIDQKQICGTPNFLAPEAREPLKARFIIFFELI